MENLLIHSRAYSGINYMHFNLIHCYFKDVQTISQDIASR